MCIRDSRSYDRLMAAGFVCFTLGEFTATEAEAFAHHWQTAHAETPPSEGDATSEGTAPPPTPWLPRRGTIRPLDLALRAVVWTEHNVIPAGRAPLLAQAFDYELKQMDDSPLSPDQWRAALGPLALTLHREDRHTATREEVETLIRQLFLAKEGDAVREESSQPTEATEETEKAAGVQADELPEGEPPPGQPVEEQKPGEQEIDEKERKRRERELARQEKIKERERRKREKEAEKQRKREERQREEREREAAKRARKALASLLRDTALLVERDRDHLVFASSALRTYLAAWQLAQADNPQSGALGDEVSLLTAHVRDPRWQEVLALYVALAPVTPLVVARMQGKDDLFHSDLLAVAEYISIASQSEGRPPRHLRDGILGELAKVMMRPGQPLALRRAATQALVRTGNKGVPLLFHRALTDADPYLRAVAAWGLGEWATGDEEDGKAVPALIRALADPEWLVRAAALHALATIGGEAATDGLVEGLQHEDEFTRRVAAEALARLGATGHSLLKEAVDLTDMHIRRAAVYGLAEVDRPWVMERLNGIVRDDPEWIVRSAAETVLEVKEAGPPTVEPPLQVAEMGWLIRWAAERGEPVGTGDAAYETLLRALEEGAPEVRRAAAWALGLAGRPEHIPALRRATGDPDPEVATAALAALAELGRRHDVMVT